MMSQMIFAPFYANMVTLQFVQKLIGASLKAMIARHPTGHRH